MPRRLLLEGAAIEPLLRQARAEHGQSARIVKAEKVRVGGVGGFFAKERYEVTVEVDDEAVPEQVPPPQGGAASAGGAGGAGGAQGPAPARGIAALLAAAEEAERGSAGVPAVTSGPSPSAAALVAVREAMASRDAARSAAAPAPAAAAGPAVPAGRGFGDVLAALRAGGAEVGAPDEVRAPDDARSITQDLAIAAQDPDQGAALEAVRRALDALGIVDDTAEIAAAAAAAEHDEVPVPGGPDVTSAAPVPVAPVAPPPAAPSRDVPAFRPSVPERLGVAAEPARGDAPSVEAAVAMLQELPSSLVPAAAAAEGDGGEPAERPMTRRERRLAEAAEMAEAAEAADAAEADDPSGAEPSPPVEDHDHDADDEPDVDGRDDAEAQDEAPGEAEVRDDPVPATGEPSVDGADEPADGVAPTLDEDPDEDPDQALDVAPDAPAPLPPLPTTLAALGEPEPGEALPDLPAVPAALAARPSPAAPAPPSSEQPLAPAAPPRADLGSVADRLERLGVDRRWLQDAPADLSSALRQLARRLAASPPRPRRSPQAADNPVVAVLAEDAGGLETARTLAVGLGLRADEVTVLTPGATVVARSRTGATTTRRAGVPLDRAAAARAAHGGRRRTAPTVVMVPTPFAASPGERAAAAAVLASLDADQVWAVVDATRRTSDVEGWLRAVGPSCGVDAVALVGTGSTTAPAASLRLSVPVVLLDGRPATAVDWVVHLAAHLVREDLEDHLGCGDDLAGARDVRGGEAS